MSEQLIHTAGALAMRAVARAAAQQRPVGPEFLIEINARLAAAMTAAGIEAERERMRAPWPFGPRAE